MINKLFYEKEPAVGININVSDESKTKRGIMSEDLSCLRSSSISNHK